MADVKKQKHNLRIYFKVLDYDGAILTDGLEGRFIVDNKGRSLKTESSSQWKTETENRNKVNILNEYKIKIPDFDS